MSEGTTLLVTHAHDVLEVYLGFNISLGSLKYRFYVLGSLIRWTAPFPQKQSRLSRNSLKRKKKVDLRPIEEFVAKATTLKRPIFTRGLRSAMNYELDPRTRLFTLMPVPLFLSVLSLGARQPPAVQRGGSIAALGELSRSVKISRALCITRRRHSRPMRASDVPEKFRHGCRETKRNVRGNYARLSDERVYFACRTRWIYLRASSRNAMKNKCTLKVSKERIKIYVSRVGRLTKSEYSLALFSNRRAFQREYTFANFSTKYFFK